MRPRIASLTLAVCLGWGCGKPKPVDTPKAQPPDEPIVNAKSRDCDFNKYRPVRMSDWLPRGVRYQGPTPDYPAEAKRRGLQGHVNVRILINNKGEVEQACALDGPAPLREAAEVAARKWRFRPPLLNGEPWATYIDETLQFQFVIDR